MTLITDNPFKAGHHLDCGPLPISAPRVREGATHDTTSSRSDHLWSVQQDLNKTRHLRSPRLESKALQEKLDWETLTQKMPTIPLTLVNSMAVKVTCVLLAERFEIIIVHTSYDWKVAVPFRSRLLASHQVHVKMLKNLSKCSSIKDGSLPRINHPANTSLLNLEALNHCSI